MKNNRLSEIDRFVFDTFFILTFMSFSKKTSTEIKTKAKKIKNSVKGRKDFKKRERIKIMEILNKVIKSKNTHAVLLNVFDSLKTYR